jgi:hypothetical protein
MAATDGDSRGILPWCPRINATAAASARSRRRRYRRDGSPCFSCMMADEPLCGSCRLEPLDLPLPSPRRLVRILDGVLDDDGRDLVAGRTRSAASVDSMHYRTRPLVLVTTLITALLELTCQKRLRAIETCLSASAAKHPQTRLPVVVLLNGRLRVHPLLDARYSRIDVPSDRDDLVSQHLLAHRGNRSADADKAEGPPRRASHNCRPSECGP